jgi:hypothetical protein
MLFKRTKLSVYTDDQAAVSFLSPPFPAKCDRTEYPSDPLAVLLPLTPPRQGTFTTPGGSSHVFVPVDVAAAAAASLLASSAGSRAVCSAFALWPAAGEQPRRVRRWCKPVCLDERVSRAAAAVAAVWTASAAVGASLWC